MVNTHVPVCESWFESNPGVYICSLSIHGLTKSRTSIMSWNSCLMKREQPTRRVIKNYINPSTISGVKLLNTCPNSGSRRSRITIN